MKVYLNDTKKPTSKLYTHVKTVNEAFKLIESRKMSCDPVEEISIPDNQVGLKLLQKLDGELNLLHVVLQEPANQSNDIYTLIQKNHWNKLVLSKRSAEIIMVIKGNHNLDKDLNGDDIEIKALPSFLNEVALYLSDDCDCSYEEYVRDTNLLYQVINQTILDFMRVCDNPSSFLATYFEAKRMWGDLYDDLQCWCSALRQIKVRDDDHFVNGFNAYNTTQYTRVRPFKNERIEK